MPKAKKTESSAVENKPVSVGLVRKAFMNKYVASFSIVAVSIYMALSGEAASLWPIFGASNQLMSALTLLVISLWLLSKNVNWLVAFIPMVFMLIMSLWGVSQVISQQWNSNGVLVGLGFVLVVMACMLVALGLSVIVHTVKTRFLSRTAEA